MFVLSGGMKIFASAANVRLCPLDTQHSLRRLDGSAPLNRGRWQS